MPYDVRHHPSHRLAVVCLSGTATGEDIVGAIAELVGGPWEPSHDGVADLRDVDRFSVTEADLGGVAGAVREVKPVGHGGRTAYVVRGDNGDAAARRIIEATSPLTDREQRVYYTLGAAAEWLGVPENLLERPAPNPPLDSDAGSGADGVV